MSAAIANRVTTSGDNRAVSQLLIQTFKLHQADPKSIRGMQSLFPRTVLVRRVVTLRFDLSQTSQFVPKTRFAECSQFHDKAKGSFAASFTRQKHVISSELAYLLTAVP
ncbi:hypothetical protein K227x_05360 [Rubripirellula lacrimiformis]|uniref:Uncharacterized protein n=1 Tax=Rubripirellula lacrimiformis TaxID=1930273 RepID=A0A517N4W2_9BACT|nr:hypothetical protein K227x_05360 [Rubripirellula lacrimiformis]